MIDTLDAMTSDRTYRKELSFDTAKAEIQRMSGTQFDPPGGQGVSRSGARHAGNGVAQVRHGFWGRYFVNPSKGEECVMDRLNPWRVGSATALTAGTASLICAVAVWLFPEGAVSFVNSWTHGLDLAVIRSNKPLTLDSYGYGLFNVTLTGYFVGVLFAGCYNLVVRCPFCR